APLDRSFVVLPFLFLVAGDCSAEVLAPAPAALLAVHPGFHPPRRAFRPLSRSERSRRAGRTLTGTPEGAIYNVSDSFRRVLPPNQIQVIDRRSGIVTNKT